MQMDYSKPDWNRITHLYKFGIFASLLALIGGDMLLGWGTADLSLSGMEQYFSRYSTVSDARIFWAATLGMLVFGPFCHVMCCATIYYHNALERIRPDLAINETLQFAKVFLLPVSGIFLVFFLIMNIVQIMAFAKGKTPYPRWCVVFTMLIGIIDIVIMRMVGNQAWALALSTGWLSVGSFITFTGLLLNVPKAKNTEA